MTLAPHFVTSLSDFEVFGRKTAGDVTVETSRITSPSKNEIKAFSTVVDVAAEMTIFAEIGIHKYRNKNETGYRYINESSSWLQ